MKWPKGSAVAHVTTIYTLNRGPLEVYQPGRGGYVWVRAVEGRFAFRTPARDLTPLTPLAAALLAMAKLGRCER